MREGWKPAHAWEPETRGKPYRRLVVGEWECSIRRMQLGDGYLWAVKRRAWLADWQHASGLASSVEEAMYEAETALQSASGLKTK